MMRPLIPLLALAAVMEFNGLQSQSANGDCTNYDSEVAGPWRVEGGQLRHGTLAWPLARENDALVARFGWPAMGVRPRVVATVRGSELTIDTDWGCRWSSRAH